MTDTATTENGKRPAGLDKAVVVGGGLWWYQGQRSRALALPWSFDDVTRDFGDDLYERMLFDSRVAACDILLRAAILEEGIALAPAVADADADGYDQAKELLAFVEPQMEDLETALDDVLWDMLACMALGNRVAEIEYWPFDASPQPGRAVLRSLTVKPRESTAFVVDPYMRLLGFVGREQGRPLVSTGALIDPATNANFIPREKFAVTTFRPKNNDPRGTSDLRPAYNPWWLKMQTWQEFLKYLAQFASPSIVGKTAKGATVVTDPATGLTINAVDALLDRLIAFQNGTAMAFPAEYEIQLLFSQGEGAAFFRAFTLYNNEITMAITTQALAMAEGDKGTRAQASVHQDALGTIVHQAKRSTCRMVRRDVLRNLVRYNYGDKLAPLTPLVSLGETEAEDIAKLIAAFAQLQASGYLDPSQYAGVDRQLNLPPRAAAPEQQPPPGGGQQNGGTTG